MSGVLPVGSIEVAALLDRATATVDPLVGVRDAQWSALTLCAKDAPAIDRLIAFLGRRPAEIVGEQEAGHG